MPSTASAAAAAPAPSTARRTARLIHVLRIGEGEKVTHYALEELDPNVEVGSPAFRLAKIGSSDVYDVIRTDHGYECNCGDGHFRRQNTEEKCKHVGALKAVGLFDWSRR